jgi:DHA1 family bicyclomycin/chloramphenicol resistance-like MFS transporter
VLQARFGLSASQFSAVFAVNSVGIMLGGRLSGRALRRFSSSTVLGGGLAVMTAATTVLLVAAVAGEGLPALLPPLFVAVGCVGVLMPNATALALLRHGRSAGTASALLGALQYLAGAVAGPLAAIRSASTIAMATGMTTVVVAALAIWAAALRPAARRPQRSSDRADAVAALCSNTV